MLNIRLERDDCQQLRLDAGETAFVSRQLTYVKAINVETIYTGFSAFDLFPITSEAGSAAKSIVWRVWDRVGEARVIASYADDLPKAGILATENTTPVRTLGASYGWSLQDMRSAMMGGVNLDMRLAAATLQAHNQKINKIAWRGDAEHGMPGLKSDTNIPTSAAGIVFSSATADQIIDLVNGMLTGIMSATKGTQNANVVALPPAQLAIMMSKPRSTTSDTSVLAFLQTSWPGVRFIGVQDLENWTSTDAQLEAGTDTDDAIIAMNNSPGNMSLEIPQPYQEEPVERHALRFEVATHSRVAGLLVYYPKSVSIRTGI